jgi:hypothetical protein
MKNLERWERNRCSYVRGYDVLSRYLPEETEDKYRKPSYTSGYESLTLKSRPE